MTVSPDARSPSADLYTLTGSTPPGAGTVLPPFEVAANRAANADDTFKPLGGAALDVVARLRPVDPDAEVIALADRVVRLAHTEERALKRRCRIEAQVERAMPPAPKLADAIIRLQNEMKVGEDGSRVMSIIEPAGWADENQSRNVDLRAAEAEHQKLERSTSERFGLDRAEALVERVTRRLYHAGQRLAAFEPATQVGLKAKAAASVIVNGEGLFLDTWRQELALTISRDALRIISAEAEARAEQDRQADDELLALGRLWEESCERDGRAHLLWLEAEDSFDPPAVPDALWVRDEDRKTLGLAGPSRRDIATGRAWYGEAVSIQSLRNSATWGAPLPRRDEILEAYDGWQAGRREAREVSGLTAAEMSLAATVKENADLRARICRMPAHTPAGIDLKMRVILWLHDGLAHLEAERQAQEVENPDFSEALALSIVLDLARMGRDKTELGQPAQIARVA